MPAAHHSDGSAPARRQRWKWAAGVATAVLVAGLSAIVSGFGEEAVDSITAGDAPLLSYGLEELGTECGTSTYLPDSRAAAVLGHQPPYELQEWIAFRHQPGAAYADSDLIQVSVQGESSRDITLTRVEFEVEHRRRRGGGTFSAACGDALRGQGIQVDLEARPPRIVSSSESLDGIITAGGTPGSDTTPISFPWTVSLTDPLLLYVLATVHRCDCVWQARIPWVSGSESGVIEIDNEGQGYRVVGSEGLAAYSSIGNEWLEYRPAGAQF